jgi:hypothetical protein
MFMAQTTWIADNIDSLNIKFVLHLGDITENNREAEWQVARQAFSVLDGKIPYVLAVGNHDLGTDGSADRRTSLFSKYFPGTDYGAQAEVGGVYDKEPDNMDNIFFLFDVYDKKWLVLSLEFGPRDDVIRWANQVVGGYPGRSVIVITHAYLKNDGTRYNRTFTYGVADSAAGINIGEDMWQKFVSRHQNIELVLSGHTCTSAHRTDQGINGNNIHQILVDYQNRPRGGNGWLRLLKFSADHRELAVEDYSPVLRKTSTDSTTVFRLML